MCIKFIIKLSRFYVNEKLIYATEMNHREKRKHVGKLEGKFSLTRTGKSENCVREKKEKG